LSVIKLSEITDFNVAKYGGKAVSLAKMLKAGVSVPPGFVIDTDSYLQMDDDLREQINSAFIDLDAECVAVRSSAPAEDGDSAAWAGQLETFLNTTNDNLIENIEACWASLGSDRAKAYAEENDVDLSTQKVAVIVQAMVQSDVSGVAFSVHPVTQNIDQVVIEAAYGLGEAVVSGQVTPDTYVVSKNSGRINDKYIAKQTKRLDKKGWQGVSEDGGVQKISDEQITELTAMAVKLEDYFDMPIDVEWLLKEGILYITQSRPITTLEKKI